MGENRISRSVFLRGGLAVTAASVSAGLSGVRPADAEMKGGAKPHSREQIKQVYARETRQAGGTWCSLVTMAAAADRPRPARR